LLDLNLIELKPVTDKNAKFYSHLVNFSDNQKNTGDALLSNDLFPIWYYHKDDENWENLSLESDTFHSKSEDYDSINNETSLHSTSNLDDTALLSEINKIVEPVKNEDSIIVKSTYQEIAEEEAESTLDLQAEVADYELLEIAHEEMNDKIDIVIKDSETPSNELVSDSTLDLETEVADYELLDSAHEEMSEKIDIEIKDSEPPTNELVLDSTLDLQAEVADYELLESVHEERIDTIDLDINDSEIPSNELASDSTLDLQPEVADNELLGNTHEEVADSEILTSVQEEISSENDFDIHIETLSKELVSESTLDLESEVADNELLENAQEQIIPKNDIEINEIDTTSIELESESTVDFVSEPVVTELVSNVAENEDSGLEIVDNSAYLEELESQSNLDHFSEVADNDILNSVNSVDNQELSSEIDEIELNMMLNELGITENVTSESEKNSSFDFDNEQIDPSEQIENFDAELIHSAHEEVIDLRDIDATNFPSVTSDSEVLEDKIEESLNKDINELISLQESQIKPELNGSNEGQINLYLPGKESHYDINAMTIEELRSNVLEINKIGAKETTPPPAEFVGKLIKKSKKTSYLFEEMEELNGFNRWLLKLTPIAEGNIAHLKKAKKKFKKKKKKYVLEEGIANSIRKNNALVSESLAQILANQGHNAKAIEMYNQLILNYPEKSVYFAAQIEKLKTD
jgi:hypothetical protein